MAMPAIRAPPDPPPDVGVSTGEVRSEYVGSGCAAGGRLDSPDAARRVGVCEATGSGAAAEAVETSGDGVEDGVGAGEGGAAVGLTAGVADVGTGVGVDVGVGWDDDSGDVVCEGAGDGVGGGAATTSAHPRAG